MSRTNAAADRGGVDRSAYRDPWQSLSLFSRAFHAGIEYFAFQLVQVEDAAGHGSARAVED